MTYVWAYDWEVVEWNPVTNLVITRSFETEKDAEDWVIMNGVDPRVYDIRKSAMQYLATER